jgi:hypothetical protein
MTPQKETPAPRRVAAEGVTGAGVSGRSVALAPEWARKRVAESLLRFAGEYVTPEALHAQAAAEALLARSSRGGPKAGDAFQKSNPLEHSGAAGSPTPEIPGTHPANRRSRVALIDEATGELLPCRSLETTQSRTDRKCPAGLSGQHRKVAAALAWNVEHLCQNFGIERVGFLTLTFADHVTDIREASRRFNSLASNVLKKRYAAHIRVVERQKSGRIHYHLLVVLPDDIRTGADFDAFANRDYKSANNHLRREWVFWRKTAPLFRFGRTELMPVKSDAGALGQYVGKYIGKHIGQREERDKGARLVSYSGDARVATSKHMFVGGGSDEWRAKCLTFSRLVSGWKPQARIAGVEDLAFHLGARWSYHWRDFILRLPPADLAVPF